MIKKIFTSLILSIILITTVQAAMGIPENLMPKNTPLKGLNQTIAEEVRANGQDGAVTGANIVLQYLANILLFFAAPLAVLFLARAAADYAFAMGEDSKLESAKRELTWSLVGLVLVMFSYLLVRLFIQPLSGLQTATDAQQPVQEIQAEQKAVSTESKEAYCQQVYKMSCAKYDQETNSPEALARDKKTAADEATAEQLKKEQVEFAKAKAGLEAAKKEAAKEATCQKEHGMSCAAWDATPAKYTPYKPSDDGFGSPLSGK